MTDGKNEGTPPEEGEDGLWRLLERAPQSRPVSPYFARRVLREVALLEETRPAAAGGGLNWLARTWQTWRRQPRWAFAGALGAVTLLAAGGVGFSVMRWHSPVVPAAVSRVEPPAPAPAGEDEAVPPDAVAGFDPGPQPTVALLSEPIVVTAQDVEVIADLDNLVSREESRLWTEDDTARF